MVGGGGGGGGGVGEKGSGVYGCILTGMALTDNETILATKQLVTNDKLKPCIEGLPSTKASSSTWTCSRTL